MGKNGSILLGELAERASHIDIACSRCHRKGRYRVANLVDRLGQDFPMTDLGAELADCPRRTAAAHHERCDVYFPKLAQMMSDDEQASATPRGNP
jgi:hypothetical protein